MEKGLQVYLAVLLVLGINVIYNAYIIPTSTTILYDKQSIEVTKPGPLLNKEGLLIESGFARSPIKTLNEENLPPFLGLSQLAFLRYKKWDFFSIITPKLMVLIHVADLGYAGNISIQLNHYSEQILDTVSETIHDISKIPQLTPSSSLYNSNIDFKSDKIQLQISQKPFVTKDEHHININFTTENVSGEVSFVKPANDEEVVMISKLNEDGSKFYYNTKSYGLQATKGTINWVDDKGIKQNITDTEKWLGGRDIGRGVWNYRSFWFWAHAQTKITNESGEQINLGINLGNGFEDPSTNAYEDSVIMGGRLHKLKPIRRTIEEDDIEVENIFRTDGDQSEIGSAEFVFQGLLQQKQSDNFIVAQSKLNKIFGHFYGWFINEESEKVEIKVAPGFIELHRVKW